MPSMMSSQWTAMIVRATAASAQGEARQASGPASPRIFVGSFKQGEISPDSFRHASLMGLELGIEVTRVMEAFN